ncbi:hypothetical protein AB1Y20_014444 [Prymnesium parvum]|uniref:Uncharacterized protein n=1 Tax=Prymnesium parvum TaxID=97485 RepID=A0AB34IF80_PRYPA
MPCQFPHAAWTSAVQAPPDRRLHPSLRISHVCPLLPESGRALVRDVPLAACSGGRRAPGLQTISRRRRVRAHAEATARQSQRRRRSGERRRPSRGRGTSDERGRV